MFDVTRAYGLTFHVPERDRAIGECLRLFGEFARVELDLLSVYAQRTETGAIVDVGANIGAISAPLAARFRNRPVISLEASCRLHALLATNATVNGLTNMTALNVAAGATSGVVKFQDINPEEDRNYGTLSLAKGAHQQGTSVLMLTLDELAPKDVRIIKVDVEGYEAEVLKGSPRLLSETRPVWLLEAGRENEASYREVMSVLFAHDYKLFWFASPFVSRLSLKPSPQTLPNLGDVSMLALPAYEENVWELPAIRDIKAVRPGIDGRFGYLERYGFEFNDSR